MAIDRHADEAFFRELYETCHRPVYAYFLARTGNKELAKDLMQETFMRAWRGIRAARSMGRDASRWWLMRIARNLLTDHYRRAAASSGAEERMRREAAACAPHAEPPDEKFDVRERVRRIGDAMLRLPAELRESLLLQSIGGLSSTEIGKLLGLPAGTVRYRVSMARRKLREMLGEDGGDATGGTDMRVAGEESGRAGGGMMADMAASQIEEERGATDGGGERP